MLTRQGALRIFQAEFQRLADIDIDFSDNTPIHCIAHRPKELIMAEKTVANLLSKSLEQIPKYSGKPDQNADEWLKELTSTFRLADINESQAIKIIPTFFEGPAKQWYLENNTTFESWSVFKAEFLHTYSSPALKQLASHRLRTRQQRIDEPVNEYYTDIMKLCKIVDPNMTDVSKIDHLYHGIKSSLMKEVLRLTPRTSAEFLEYARKEETLDRLVTRSVNQTASAIDGTAAFNNTFHSNVAMDNTEHFNNMSNTSSKPYFNKAYSSRSLRCYQCNKHNGGSDSHPFQPSYYFLYNNLNHSVKNPQYRPPFNRLQYSHYHKTKRTTVPAHSQSPAIQQVIKQHLTPQTVPRTNPSLIFVKINVHGIRLRAMLDTGATRSFITQRALAKIHHYSLQPRDRIAQLGDGHTMLKIVGEVHLWLKFDQIFTPLNVLVVKNLNTDFILGAGWCTQNAVQINYDTNQVSIRSSTGRIIIPYDTSIDYLTLDVKLINSVKIPPCPEQQAAFNEFKNLLTTYPLFLEYPDLSTPFVLTTDASEIGIGGILRQDTITGTKINYFKSRVLSDTERKYDTIEREALAIYWCLTELRSYIGDSDIIIETDHEPLQNFHKKQINNKRSNNTAADYISRHFPSSNVINNSTILAEQTYDWSVGIEQWFKDLPKPQRLRFATSFINTTNSTINPVTTRAKAKLIAQSVPPTSAEPSTTTPPFSAPSSTSDYLPFDFSLSHIRFEQEQDPVIQQIIQNFYHKSDNVRFSFGDVSNVFNLRFLRGLN
ncbi:unnamed protein product [Rotaria socialis]